MTIKVIQQKCAQCGLTRAYDWKQGKSRSENLAMEGWRRIHKSWICPDCVNKRNNPNQAIQGGKQ